MELSLIDTNSNSYSNSNSSNSNSSNNNDDIESGNNNRRILHRIGDDDKTLEDLIKEDRSLVILLMILGFYINDERNSIGMKILGRSWQCSLLLFGGIGFIWLTFVQGGYNIWLLHQMMTSSTSTSSSTSIFIQSGFVLYLFIVPLIQVTSLIYGMYRVFKVIKQQVVNADIVLKHLATRKRIMVIYFICMTLLVILIDPFGMTRTYYKTFTAYFDDDDDYLIKIGLQNYSLFVFNSFTTNFFLNLLVTSYLSVMLFFLSVSMGQIKSLQKCIIKMIDTNTLVTEHYIDTKDKIISLKNGSYLSIQILTITAAINIITFMFMIWGTHYYYINSTDDRPFSYKLMIFEDFFQLPYLLKGYKYHYDY